MIRYWLVKIFSKENITIHTITGQSPFCSREEGKETAYLVLAGMNFNSGPKQSPD